MTTADAWKSESLVRKYLDGIRGAIPLATEQIEMMLRLVDASGSPVRRFADIGCGSGVLAAALLGRHPGAKAVLIDFSEPMLLAAREFLTGYGDACAFVTADFSGPAWQQELPVGVPFDAIVSGYAIHHASDARKLALYGEIFDLLAPGGWFVNVEHVLSPSPWLSEQFDEMLIDRFYARQVESGATITREEVARAYVNRPDKEANILAPVGEQLRWLREIGFADVDCYFKVLELAVFGGRRPE